MKKGFDNQKYLDMQSQHIRERISLFGSKLYLEFGGKLFDDYHASRVLPGFKPDSKLQMLLQLKDQAEIVIAINADDIERNKIRGDYGITYDLDVLRLIDQFREVGLYVGSVVLTRYNEQRKAVNFERKVLAQNIKVYHHYSIAGYPHDIVNIVSEEGFGRNDYIETTRPLIVVTAPGPGSGKMATCLSNIYHDNCRGVKSGYAKFETFPIWNLPLKHPVNVAYEAATADLNDVNMIDPFHLEAKGELAVNYNRDIEIFPVLRNMFEQIYGKSPYESPTDMGVNMAGYCISNDEVVCEAATQEVIRRYYHGMVDCKLGRCPSSVVGKLELLMKTLQVSTSDRVVVAPALAREAETGAPAASLLMPDGTIVVGRTSDYMGACAGILMNALKKLARIPDDQDIISEIVIQPMQALKVNSFGSKNPRLHAKEVLMALAICAATNPVAKHALKQLDKLKGCEAHCSVIVSSSDVKTFKNLGINLTCEPKYETDRLYHA